MNKIERCRRCIHWENENCILYEMSRLNNGKPVKSCSLFYSIKKYNSEYEVNKRKRYDTIVENINNDETLADAKKLELIHLIDVFNLY